MQKLFERCLVPCALYTEFWLLYIAWARTALSPEEALAIATRAATLYLPRRCDVLEALAALLESLDPRAGVVSNFKIPLVF